MSKPSQSRNRGTAILLAVFAVILMLAMGVALLSLGTNMRICATRNGQQIQARCAAER